MRRKRRTDPDVAPNIGVSDTRPSMVQINNMTIYFSDTRPVAFRRGEVQRRLPGRYTYLGTSEFTPLRNEEFEKQLYENMRVAMRGLTASYDVVVESARYSDIILRTAELLEAVLDAEWQNTSRLRAAIVPIKFFLLERLAELIRTSEERAHDVALTEISMQQLRELIETGKLQPDGKKEKKA